MFTINPSPPGRGCSSLFSLQRITVKADLGFYYRLSNVILWLSEDICESSDYLVWMLLCSGKWNQNYLNVPCRFGAGKRSWQCSVVLERKKQELSLSTFTIKF